MAIFMGDDSPVEDEWIRALEAGTPSNENKFFWSKKFGTSRILKDTPVHGLKDGKNLVPSAKFHNKSSPPFVSSRLHPGTMLDVPFQSISQASSIPNNHQNGCTVGDDSYQLMLVDHGIFINPLQA